MLKHIKLFESYQSQKDLEKLTKSILYHISDKTVNNYDDEFDGFESIKLEVFSPEYFGTLKDFIKDFGSLEIAILPVVEFRKYSGGNAAYLRSVYDDGKLYRYILLQEKEYLINKTKDKLTETTDNDTDNLYKIKKDISDYLHYEYKSSLIHELQHAYDDWRSKGKSFTEPNDYKNNKEKLNNLNLKSPNGFIPKDIKEEEIEFISKYHKIYLNLNHEVDARFADAIQKTDFYNLDLDKSFEENKDVYTIYPFKDVLRSFKGKMYPFNMLTPEQKQRVLRKLGQFYEIEKEFIKNLNLKSKPWKN